LIADKWNLKLEHWWNETDWRPGLHGKRLVTYCLRHGTAPEGRGPLGRSSEVDGKILEQWDVSVWTVFVGLRTGTGGVLLLTW